MTITNYGELKSAIARWLEREDLDESIPDFIGLAELRILREFRAATITAEINGAIDITRNEDFSGKLVGNTDTNPVLDAAPDLYLFGALVEAESFLMNDSRIPLWESKFQDQLHRLNLISEEVELSGSGSIVQNAY
ncbi:phage adaptor protein [Microbulbifer epialgicus]|uniref:Uncharacterized protein n=1 Tax=Microbulbifer epialgicus TaxID=393907 RepID=A0ABV4P5G6_9GAMM